ncbi:hypothetical protein [Clostridium sp. HMP27]|uniref:hypothetical protein n=1 Tax=Clostridium sp. HMP27 TaxID=1487921 RepID=UPI00068DCA23|nr:hypothetical protein [Clostridium sp. HMP27]
MKKRYIVIILMAIFIIFLGFIVVSNNTPKFIKNNSPFKIYFTAKPFDFKVETKKYVFYVNKKASENIKLSTYNLYNGLNDKISYVESKLEDASNLIKGSLIEVLKSIPILNIIVIKPLIQHNY